MNSYVTCEAFSFSEELEAEVAEIYARESAMILGFDVLDMATEADAEGKGKAKLGERLKALKAELPGKMRRWVESAVNAATSIFNKIGDSAAGKAIKAAYAAVGKYLEPVTKHAGELKNSIKAGAKDKVFAVKDILVEADNKLNDVISDVAAKIAGQINGRMNAQPRKKENTEKYGKDAAKAIIASEIKKAETAAKAYMSVVDELWRYIMGAGMSKDSSIASIALQCITNAYMIIGKILTIPVQVAGKVVVSAIDNKNFGKAKTEEA